MILSRFKKDSVIWLLIIGVFLFSRLVNLGAVPIFTDEAIYLHWSQVMATDAQFRYLPLTDGKPPLFMWTTSLVMKTLPNIDPLYAGRLVSVGSGLLALAGIYFLSYQLFKSRKISYLAMLCYLVSPFTFFYDRFGVVDSMLTMWGVWSLGLGLLLMKKIRLDIAMILGVVIGLGWLTKTPALFFLVYLLPLVIFYDFKNKNWKTGLLKLAGLYVLVFVIARLLYSVIFLLPQAYVVALKNQGFIVSVVEFIREPLQLLPGNAHALATWEVAYLTVPWLLLAVWGLVAGGYKFWKQKLILAGYFGIYFLFLALFNKVIYPRYLLLFTPLLFILVAYGISDLIGHWDNKLIKVAVVILAFALPIYTDFKIVTDPANAPIADNDSEQYLNSWPAGWGVNNVRDFFHTESRKNAKLTLGVVGTFGLMPYALDIYHDQYPNLDIKSYWPPPDKLPNEIVAAAADHPTYYISYQHDRLPTGRLELVAAYVQGHGPDYLKLYKVWPK